MSISSTVGQVRNVGSSYTTFQYGGRNIAFLETINDQGQQPVSGAEFIHPLGQPHPVDIVTSRALQGGRLILSIRELWNREVWEQLPGLTGAKTIVDIFNRLARTPNYVTCAKIITPPSGPRYGKVYHRCVITGIGDGEMVTIGTLSVAKDITVSYTHTTPL